MLTSQLGRFAHLPFPSSAKRLAVAENHLFNMPSESS
jgi:hypothetical protein